MQLRRALFQVLLISACLSCSDETIQNKLYPYVLTQSVNVLDQGVEVIADVVQEGIAPITRYGFVFSEPSSGLESFVKVGDGAPGAGEFFITLTSGLRLGETYSVRAYAETQTQKIYGNSITFESRGSLPPKITSFSPLEGPVGTTVKLSGDNLGPFMMGMVVKFGEVETLIDSINADGIYVRVPFVTESNDVQITIEIAGTSSVSANYFAIWFPWTRKADFPGTYLVNLTSFEAGARLYVIGGLRINPWELINEFWEYDPETDVWEQKPAFPGAIRYEAIAFSANGKGYYGLGRNATEYLTDFWEYDPTGDAWTQKSSFPGDVTSNPKAFAVQNNGYVGLGYAYLSGAGFINDIWQFDPLTNAWYKKMDFPSGRYPGFSLGATDRGYLGMGTSGGIQRDFYEYNPEANAWQFVGYYPGQGNNSIGGFFIDGMIYMGMGSDNGSNSFADFWRFDPIQQEWTELRPCPTRLAPSVSAAINNKGYIGYGWYNLTWQDQTIGRAFYEFDPAKN